MSKVYPNKHTQLCWQVGFVVSYPVGGETFKYGDNVSITIEIGSSTVDYIMSVHLYGEDGTEYGLVVQNVPVKDRGEVTSEFKLKVRHDISPGEYFYRAVGSNSPRSQCYTDSNLFNIVL